MEGNDCEHDHCFDLVSSSLTLSSAVSDASGLAAGSVESSLAGAASCEGGGSSILPPTSQLRVESHWPSEAPQGDNFQAHNLAVFHGEP